MSETRYAKVKEIGFRGIRIKQLIELTPYFKTKMIGVKDREFLERKLLYDILDADLKYICNVMQGHDERRPQKGRAA